MPSVNFQPLAGEEPQFRHLDEATQERVRDLQPRPAPAQALRRTGLRPYAFNGTVAATVSGITPALPYWYELNIHQTVLGTFVSDIRLFHKSADKADLFRVEEHADLDGVFAYFESYDPSGDLSPAREMLERQTSNAALALGTARLQMQVNQIGDHYRALVGVLLGAVATR